MTQQRLEELFEQFANKEFGDVDVDSTVTDIITYCGQGASFSNGKRNRVSKLLRLVDFNEEKTTLLRLFDAGCIELTDVAKVYGAHPSITVFEHIVTNWYTENSLKLLPFFEQHLPKILRKQSLKNTLNKHLGTLIIQEPELYEFFLSKKLYQHDSLIVSDDEQRQAFHCVLDGTDIVQFKQLGLPDRDAVAYFAVRQLPHTDPVMLCAQLTSNFEPVSQHQFIDQFKLHVEMFANECFYPTSRIRPDTLTPFIELTHRLSLFPMFTDNSELIEHVKQVVSEHLKKLPEEKRALIEQSWLNSQIDNTVTPRKMMKI